MPLQTWLLFVATVFFVSATPGPNMLLAMTHGIRYGIRHTLPTMAGLLTALSIIMVGSAIGLGALVATSERLFSLVKYLGAAYLIWLGFKTWRSKPQLLEEQAEQITTTHAGSPWVRFRTGFLVAMSNPKAFIFFTALFPQFMNTHQPQGPQLMILAGTFYVIESSWQFAYAAGGAHLRTWLNTHVRLKWLNRFAGGSFMAAGVALSTVNR